MEKGENEQPEARVIFTHDLTRLSLRTSHLDVRKASLWTFFFTSKEMYIKVYLLRIELTKMNVYCFILDTLLDNPT